MRNAYELQLERRAKKALEELPDRDYERIQMAIDALALEPRPPGCLKLQDSGSLWRIRVGEYRVIYAIFDRERMVRVAKVERRTGQTYAR